MRSMHFDFKNIAKRHTTPRYKGIAVVEFLERLSVLDRVFSYDLAPGSDGEFKIFLGNRSDMEGAWFEPINYFPQLYEKIEWGVKLPDEVEAAIDNWIWNDQNPTLPPLAPALNPFDPEQIDLQAIVDYTTSEGVYVIICPNFGLKFIS